MSSTSIYDAIIAQAAAAYGVPGEWIKAVIGAETSFVSPAPRRWESAVNEYAWGPMQILLSTARGLGFSGTGEDLADPLNNIAVGAEYLAQLRDLAGNDFRRVYSAYNSGNPDKWTASSQVGANVARAVDWLASFGGSPEGVPTPAEDSGTVAAVIVGLAGAVWWWIGPKRKKRL